MVGGGTIERMLLLIIVPVPPTPVTAIYPETFEAASVTLIWVLETTVKAATATLFTLTAEAPVKLFPVMVKVAEGQTLAGDIDVMVGAVERLAVISMSRQLACVP